MNLDFDFFRELLENDFKESIYNPIKLFRKIIQSRSASGYQYTGKPINLLTKVHIQKHMEIQTPRKLYLDHLKVRVPKVSY